jgi:hypothetical protein
MDSVAHTSGIVTQRNVSLRCVRVLGVWVRARGYLTGTGKDAMSDRRLVYFLREDAAPYGELAALAAVYAFVIQAHEQKKAAAPANERRKEVDSEERRQGQGQ